MFRFKQFTIQDRCAMKVCTDACMLGAWVADQIKTGKIIANDILDIGAGTGLLSLMLAQKTNANIDAVEINKEAFEQAAENVAASPWANKIKLFHGSVADHLPGKEYDLIICNPPFYENHLISPDSDRNTAMHTVDLSFEMLAAQIKRLLSRNGTAIVLLPFNQTGLFEGRVSAQEFFIAQCVKISHSAKHKYSRCILFLSGKKCETEQEEILIKDNTGMYSQAFQELLRDYYPAF